MKEKNSAIALKNDCIKRLDECFCKHIESAEFKKSNLLAYWIKEFANYHDEEKHFDNNNVKCFKRGDIIKVNLGFNIGSELGGLHYCIVISKNDNHSFNTLNVVPLSSIKEGKDYDVSSLLLGDELYSLLQKKYKYELSLAKSELAKILNIDKSQTTEIKKLTNKLNYLEKIIEEINKMKNGSVALVHQITTISKQRIYNPKTSRDILSGIRLSAESMDKLDEKIKKLFTK